MADISYAVHEYGGNVEETRMHRVGDYCTVTLMTAFEAEGDDANVQLLDYYFGLACFLLLSSLSFSFCFSIASTNVATHCAGSRGVHSTLLYISSLAKYVTQLL